MFEALGAPELFQSLTRADAVPAVVLGACSTLALTRAIPLLARLVESIRSPRAFDRWRLRWRYRAETRGVRVPASPCESRTGSWRESDAWSADAPPSSMPVSNSASRAETALEAESPVPQSHNPCCRGVAAPVLLMGAQQQVDEFLVWARAQVLGKNPATGRWEYVAQHDQWFELYRRWAVARSISVMPSSVFLKLLGKATGVEKGRGLRARDPLTGKVLKTPHGTDVRPPIYTLVFLIDVPKPAEDGKDPAKVLAAKHGIARKAAREASAAADAVRPARFLPERDEAMETWAEAMHEIYGRRHAA